MSTRGLIWVTQEVKRLGPGVSSAAKLVLLALANRHNWETGRCDPSVQTIADDLGLDDRTVRRGLRQLEEAGSIRTEHRVARTGRGQKNRRNRYELVGAKGGGKLPGGVGANCPTNLGRLTTPADLVIPIDGDEA